MTLNADGSFNYSPNPNFNGTDTFSYRASDGESISGVATVSITVTAVNDPPVAVNDVGSTAESTPLVVDAPGVLGNDSDVEGEELTAVLFILPGNGTVTLNVDGSFSYTPYLNFNGIDTFSYRASDGESMSEVATVSITVTISITPKQTNQYASTVLGYSSTFAQWASGTWQPQFDELYC